jgi:hypothetical protein
MLRQEQNIGRKNKQKVRAVGTLHEFRTYGTELNE